MTSDRLCRCAGVRLGLVLSFGVLTLVGPVRASDQVVGVRGGFVAEECVVFREGGAGLIFKAPTYWVQGHVQRVFNERKLAGLCPVIGKPLQSYTHDDWVRLVSALPCVSDRADVREVDTERVQVVVDSWETPWSLQHGTVGWLFRGHFLDRALKKGESIEVNSDWLDRCEPRS